MYFCVAAPATNRPKLLRLRYQFALFCQWTFDLLADRRPAQHFVHQLLDRRHQRQLAAHRALQQETRDDEPVDFVGAFEDAIDAGIAIGALRRILFHEAVAGIDLHRLVDDVIDHLRAPDFEDRALDRIFLDRLAPFLWPRRGWPSRSPKAARPSFRPCDRRATRRHRSACHVRDFLAHQSEVADRLAERLALLGIGHRALDRNPRPAHAHRAQFEASDVQDVEGDDVPLCRFRPADFRPAPCSRSRMMGQVEDPRMPILCSSPPTENPGKFFPPEMPKTSRRQFSRTP
jgi:hypothetical protein